MDKLRKYLLNKKPTNIPSATNLARIYNVQTGQVTSLLRKLGYEQATDGSGWHLPVTPESKISYALRMSEAKWDELAELTKDVPLEDMLARLQDEVASYTVEAIRVANSIKMLIAIAIKMGVKELHYD